MSPARHDAESSGIWSIIQGLPYMHLLPASQQPLYLGLFRNSQQQAAERHFSGRAVPDTLRQGESGSGFKLLPQGLVALQLRG